MKFLTIVLIFVGLIFLFNAGGIETNSGQLVTGLMEEGLGYFSTSNVWNTLTAILTGVAVTGVVAGLFGRTPDVSWILGGLASVFGGIVLSDMLSIWVIVATNTTGWILSVITLIMSLMVFGFFISLIAWWRGID
jgi:CBS domain containing-hemolysin-like protein